ncbi:NUMOD4 motif-containing HNH endonuclease [Brevundimonas olei]|uniref:NUMOD4 motif-containing HNH endonuclease n=1 Tax=Brevundimonas olei TaxID=657642 RepID=UPI0031DD8992
MTEIWKAVVGREGEYEVSDLGRVRSLDRVEVYQRVDQYSGRLISVTRRHAGRMLRPGRQSSGHMSVVLGRGNTTLVHRLVLEAFAGPCPPGLEALHRDDAPGNNTVGNLRWGTRSENLHDAVRNGKKPVGERVWNAKLRDRDIPLIRRALEDRTPEAVANDFGVSPASIRQIQSGRAWAHIQGKAA